MAPGRSSKAIVVIVGLWALACAAAISLATTSDQALAQGCGGGGSPSPSASSPSPSPSDDNPLPTDLPVTFPPAPDQKAAAPQPPRLDPHKEIPVATAQAETCRSTITIAYESGKNPKFTGKVGSDEPMCKRARNVTVKKVKRGADPTVGKAVTNGKGNYVVPVRKEAKGRFYSKVSKATTENDDGEPITCQAARSRTIRP